jgi:RNA recognition motif-containing protein
MTKRLFVGNLPEDVTESELTALFTQAGAINKVRIVTNRATGRSKGFAFVEMGQGGDEAIAVFNGRYFNGRTLTVIDARSSLHALAYVKTGTDSY